MQITPAVIEAHREALTNPKEYNIDITPLKECFEPSETATPAHVLHKQYESRIDRDVPKMIFYIIMDKAYTSTKAKAPNGDMGYKLKITTPVTPSS